MLRFYNIFKLAFLCVFRLGIHGWRGFIGCFSVAIFCWEKNNLAKSVTFFIFSSESLIFAPAEQHVCKKRIVICSQAEESAIWINKWQLELLYRVPWSLSREFCPASCHITEIEDPIKFLIFIQAAIFWRVPEPRRGADDTDVWGNFLSGLGENRGEDLFERREGRKFYAAKK